MPCQINIIKEVNRFLTTEDTPLPLNDSGICGGLASVLVYYALDGRTSEFFELSKQLAQLPEDFDISQGSRLALFVREIEIEFNRYQYSKGATYQGEMEGTVFINEKSIKKEFTLGLVESKQNWAKILEQIYNEGRACIIGSHNHAIAMLFIDNQYVIYDPNYDEDADPETENRPNTRSFPTAETAINELAAQFGYPENGAVGFGLQVYAHPDAKQPNYPEKKAILTSSLNKPEDFQRNVAVKSKRILDSLKLATNVNDIETISHCMHHDAISMEQCFSLMAMPVNNEIIFAFYITKNQPEKLKLMQYALAYSNFNLFDTLLNEYEKNFVTSFVEHEEFKALEVSEFKFLQYAAASGNSQCLKRVFEFYKKYTVNVSDITNKTRRIVLQDITKHGDGAALDVFFDNLPKISKQDIYNNIIVAAEEDCRSTLQSLLKKWAGQETEPLMTKNVLQKTPLINFKTLLDAGFTVLENKRVNLLKRSDQRFFEVWMARHPDPYWIEFLEKMKTDALDPKQINLFKKINGFTAFQVLAKYQHNELIKIIWSDDFLNQHGVAALKFACKIGNKEIVDFLKEKGVLIDTFFQKKQLKQALAIKDSARIKAVLACPIKNDEFFIAKNKQLIKDLIAFGEHDFVMSNWDSLNANLMPKKICLSFAIKTDNQQLYKKIAEKRDGKELIIQYLNTCLNGVLTHQNLIECIKLAEVLDEKSFHVFLSLRASSQTADKKFLKIAPAEFDLLTLLFSCAIEYRCFTFAERLKQVLPFKENKQYELFVQAHEGRNSKAMAFLLSHYPSLRQNKDVYYKLEETKHFELLAWLLEQGRCLDNTIYYDLLKRAVQRRDDRIVTILGDLVNRFQGQILDQNLKENDVETILFLLRHGAHVPSTLLAQKLLVAAINLGNDTLFKAAYKNSEFREFFNANLNDHLETIFKSASIDTVHFISERVDLQRYFEEFLYYAREKDDVQLFQRLQSQPQFKALNLEDQFNLACESHAPGITNELLRFSLVFKNERKLYAQIDKLFGVDVKDTTIDAHQIYNMLFPKALRLYEFLKEYKYRPFASLHSSINEIIFDPFLQKRSNLLQPLIKNANKPELNDEGIKFFIKHLDKPLIISDLIEYYSLDNALKAALHYQEWPMVVVLLKGRLITDIDITLLQHLQDHDAAIMAALDADARAHFKEDPRGQLNALLFRDSAWALSHVLKLKRSNIKSLIMSIQDLMIQNISDQVIKDKLNLEQRFYDFPLFEQLEKALAEDIEEFLLTTAALAPTEVVASEPLRIHLIDLHRILGVNHLLVSDFKDSERLSSLFDELQRYQEQARAKLEKQVLLAPLDSNEPPQENPLQVFNDAIEQMRDSESNKNVVESAQHLMDMIKDPENPIDEATAAVVLDFVNPLISQTLAGKEPQVDNSFKTFDEKLQSKPPMRPALKASICGLIGALVGASIGFVIGVVVTGGFGALPMALCGGALGFALAGGIVATAAVGGGVLCAAGGFFSAKRNQAEFANNALTSADRALHLASIK